MKCYLHNVQQQIISDYFISYHHTKVLHLLFAKEFIDRLTTEHVIMSEASPITSKFLAKTLGLFSHIFKCKGF